MRVTFLGTGTSQGVPVIGCACPVCTSPDPRDDLLRVSVLVETGGRSLLIDAGPDLRQQLLRAGVKDLDAVLLTHEHTDHMLGMDDLRPISFAHQPSKAVPIYADEPTRRAVRRVYDYAFVEPKYPGVPEFDLRSIPRAAFDVEGIEVIPVEVMHLRMPVLGFRIGAFAYITDAKTIAPQELDKLRGVDTLVLNALREQPHYSHLNIAEAMAIVEEVRPRQAWFTHVSHLTGPHAAMNARLPAYAQLAHDGLVIDVPDQR